MKKYSLVWIRHSKKSEIGLRLNVPDNFGLPYFLEGDEVERFRNKQLKNLTPFHLLRGLLIGYHDNPPTIDVAAFRKVIKTVINDLRAFFRFDTTENLILSVSANLRRDNGDHASYLALLAATELYPESSKIRFDCCIDLYNQLEREEFKEVESGKEKLGQMIKEIDVTKINPEFISSLTTFEDWLKAN